jgi:hypothetical protein
MMEAKVREGDLKQQGARQARNISHKPKVSCQVYSILLGDKFIALTQKLKV